jgi:hypothetical protein
MKGEIAKAIHYCLQASSYLDADRKNKDNILTSIMQV